MYKKDIAVNDIPFLEKQLNHILQQEVSLQAEQVDEIEMQM